VTLRAAGHVVQETSSFGARHRQTRRRPSAFHQPGGTVSRMLGDMLLEALVGCAGVTLAAVATAMGSS